VERHTRANSVYRSSAASSCSEIKQPRRQDAYAIVAAGLLSLIAPSLAQDQPSAPSPPQIEKKQLDAVTPAIQRKCEELKIWGLAIAVGRSGHILYEHGFGFQDADKLKPIDPETHFEIGSITKQFTAAAILQLKGQGKLSLDDTLATYLPTFPHGTEISIRQLLNQTSGLADYFSVKGFDKHELGGFEKIVSLIEKEPLEFVPGESFVYSNTNYIALGRIVEVVSGESYRQYIQHHLFDPAGMSQSTTMVEEDSVKNMASGFASDPKKPERTVPAVPLKSRLGLVSGLYCVNRGGPGKVGYSTKEWPHHFFG
jgi:CubicO group peptidase (beta-lactamase class C family)